ncbi:MAG: acyl-CoA dehydrogenase [Myxococcales bacterium]|nr:acyl-CoA dehydrogenase [Myxococcales bacterium]
MSTVHHYKPNLRDLEFNLFEFLRIQDDVLGNGAHAGMDEDTARASLEGLTELCEKDFAAGFASADRDGLSLDKEGNVTVPDGIKSALSAYFDNDWHLLDAPAHLGGFGAPPSVSWAGFELLAGANASACFYLLGVMNARVIDRLGTETQKALFAERTIDRKWGGTMMLTEPDAGSDVGAGTSRAKHVDGEVWELEGTKRFITNGDFDATENIIHLVLARREGGEPGTKGLSMFIVPKFWVNDDGSLGDRNGIYVSGLEHKMGITASATCEMVMGDHRGPCRGYLVGNAHQGIRQMFQVIEHARMCVGMKSMATLSTGYLNALQYAKERIQGPDLKQAANKTAPRVEIIKHPDVRRMLMAQKAHAEGMRALNLFTASIQDKVSLLGGHGNADAMPYDRLNDLLLPLVKGYCSEKAYELLGVSLQTFGGAGYVQDYPLEQYVRDQKIDSLYEGTTHIQSLDLIFRKIARDGGKTLQGLMAQVQKTVETGEGGELLAPERQRLLRALGDVQGIMTALMSKMQEDLYHVGLQGNRVLMALAEVVIGWLLIRHAALAAEKLDGAGRKDTAFYNGKIASAKWFCANVLPSLTLTRKLIEGSDLSLMALDDASF